MNASVSNIIFNCNMYITIKRRHVLDTCRSMLSKWNLGTNIRHLFSKGLIGFFYFFFPKCTGTCITTLFTINKTSEPAPCLGVDWGFLFYFFCYIMDVLPFYTTETRLQNQGPVIHRKDYAIH